MCQQGVFTPIGNPEVKEPQSLYNPSRFVICIYKPKNPFASTHPKTQKSHSHSSYQERIGCEIFDATGMNLPLPFLWHIPLRQQSFYTKENFGHYLEDGFLNNGYSGLRICIEKNHLNMQKFSIALDGAAKDGYGV